MTVRNRTAVTTGSAAVHKAGLRLGILLLACAAAAIVRPAHAQEPADPARLEGAVVQEASEEPLAGVTVELVDLGLVRATNAAGRYVFEAVPPGSHTVRFEVLGQAARTETVDLRAGETHRLETGLEAEAIALTPIRVLYERTRLVGDPGDLSRIPGSAHHLGAEELDRQKLLYDDVHQLLRQVPGINVREEDGYGLRPNIGIRGTGAGRSAKITVMEDGVLSAPAPYAAPAAYYFPVAGRMEAVEVRKGSSQIKSGPRTMGGAMNLVSSGIPDDLRLDVDAAGGSDATGTVLATAGGTHENVGWLLQTYQLRTDGYKRLDGGGPTGFDLRDYLLKARIGADPGAEPYQTFEVKLGYTDEVSNETYLGLTDADFAADPLRRYAASREDVMRADHRQAQARYFIRHASGLDLTATAYRNEFARNWYKLGSVRGAGISSVVNEPESHADELAILRGADSEPGALTLRANNREYVSQGIQTVAGASLSPGGVAQQLELGVRYHEDEMDRFQHEDGYRMRAGEPVLTERGEPGSQSNRISDAAAWAFFLQDRLELGRWSVTPGLRYETIRFTRTDYATDDPDRTAPDRVRENTVSVLIPGIGVTGTVAPGLTVFSGVHKGFGPPGPGADERTRAEESVNYEAGARYYRGPLGVQAVAYLNDYENVLGRATLASGESGAGELFNGGAVDVKGVELSLAYDLLDRRGGALRAPLRLAYTVTDAAFRSAFESDYGPWGTVEAGDAMPYVPDHQLHAELGVEHRGGRVTLAADYVSAMRTVAGRGAIPADRGTDAALVLNLAGEYPLTSWGTVYAGVQNLADRRYIVSRLPAGARPALPRTVTAGLRMHW